MWIVIVDAGNYSRSPAAERLLRKRLSEKGATGVTVTSGGLKDKHVGDPPDPRTIERVVPLGVDLSDFRCRQLSAEDYQADAILALDQEVLDQITARAPEGAKAVLTRLLDAAGTGGDIPDPFYGGEAGFDSAIAGIDEATTVLAEHIASGRSIAA